MKHSLLISLLISVSSLQAQTFGNEWIDYSQKYYSFKIAQSGLFKIDSLSLANAGIPIGLIPASAIQIFGRDKEVPLFMADGGDNVLNANDYFLFYAQRNNGWIDSLLYQDPTKMANPSVSLVNDTIEYFFSWKTFGNGLRFTNQFDQNYAFHQPKNFVTAKVVSPYTLFYYEGLIQDRAAGSVYSDGEGYGFGALESPSYLVQDYAIPTPNPYTGTDGPFPSIHVRSVSNSQSASSTPGLNHHLKLSVGSSNLPILDTIFYGYQQIRETQSLSHSLVNSNSTNLKYEIVDDLGAVVDRQAMTYYELIYNRIPNANNQNSDAFFIQNHPTQTKTRIDLAGLSVVSPIVFSYGSTAYAQVPVFNAGVWQMLIPNSTTGANNVFVFDINSAVGISQFKAVNETGDFTDFSLINPDSALIMVYHPNLKNASDNYAAYRSSIAGGAHNVILANILELTQQYGGGVPQHVAGVRRFVHSVYTRSSQKPVALFLMGKGISAERCRYDLPSFQAQLIPTFGFPSSDNAITSGLEGTRFEPLVPVGRISVNSNELLQSYLDKIIEYDLAQNFPVDFSSTKDWQKKILHFVGGSDAGQQTTFQSYMNTMKGIIEDSLFAGQVTNYFKTSSDPLDPIVVAGVTDKISEGVSIMNFFGHSAASNNGFEINIDDPSNWNNKGKYPLVIANSCFTGDIFKIDGTASEFYLNIPEEGAIAYFAHNTTGYAGQLSIFTTELYRQISVGNYGGYFSHQIKKTIETLQNSYGGLFFESTFSQMTLNGDPMIRVNYSTAPEIEIKPENVSFSPSNINLNVDSIEVSLTIRNLGMSITDSVFVEVTRNFPGSTTDSIYRFFIPKLNYEHILIKKFPLQPSISGGINQFTFRVDIPNQYNEQFDENGNNTTTANFFINIDGISPIWPYNYAVVPYDSVTVKASTINPIASIHTYRFELDTTDTYDSPQLRRFSLTELGGVKEVNPSQWLSAAGNSFPLVCSDSTVYFWRVAVDSSILNWSEFSFQYIEGKRGWGQDHFFQFKNNDFSGLLYDRNDRLRKFGTGINHQIFLWAFDNSSFYNQWGIDNGYFDYAALLGGAPAFYVGVLDPITFQPWGTHFGTQNPNRSFGNENDRNDLSGQGRQRVEEFFVFRQSDPAQLASFQNMIENEIPDGHYVVIYTVNKTEYDTINLYQPSLYSMFQNLGSTQFNNSQPRKPFGMIFRKGDPTSLVEKHYPDTTSSDYGPRVFVEKFVVEADFLGTETTPLIGPSLSWETLYWRRDSIESFVTDSVRLKIQQYDINQAYIGEIDTVFSPNDSIILLNNLVDATLYPYIRLSVFCEDQSFNTPAQVERLHVLYSPVPEAAIDGTLAYYFRPLDNDSLKEGQPIEFAVDVKNISDYPMDSLLVNYWIEDEQHVRHDLPYARKGPLLPSQILRDTITFSTLGYAGLNSFWMEVNPYINGSLVVTDQLEQYHFNNLLQLPFKVIGDDEHPILDVTFNGKHILNGDIIDPNSEILISLKDENPLLIMNDISDTTFFGVYLNSPDGTQVRIPFMDGQGNTIMQWYPADAQTKRFKILYPTSFAKDGKYTLIVQGSDRSGNISGNFEYRVTFEIIRESSITYLLNYPNPFSTSTRFVFTLTGTEEPEDVIIQIMTVTGRVVREITEDQLGKITIGRNISDYAWDGTDEFGDLLANGVYLYRVKAKINGEDIKHRETTADQFFKEEFGKMYLFR